MVRRLASPFLALAVVLACATATAQDKAEPPKPLFPQLFPRPTGRNGYEDLVMAGDLASLVESRVELTSPDLTLTQRREALATQEAKQALALLHRGLGKPISSPRETVTFDSTFPELARLRSLGRLLSADIRLCFADGRTRDAIASLQDGLNLAIALHGETLIGSLVSKAIEGIVINTFARDLDQLSAPDCDRLLGLARDWAKLPDPTITAVEAELSTQISGLEALRKKPGTAAQALGELLQNGEGEVTPLRDQAARIQADPAAWGKVLDDMEATLRRYYASVLTELGRQPWERQFPEYKTDGTLPGKLVEVMVPVLSRVSSRFAEARARMLLLGVHAGIRRYRWEHDRLPGSLEELKLGSVAIDPCSGTPFRYRVTSPTTYELSSGGMLPSTGGERTPIFVPNRPKAEIPGS